MARAGLVLVVMVTMVVVTVGSVAGTYTPLPGTFPVTGRIFKLKNRPLDLGGGVVCPEGRPSSMVTFCGPEARMRVVILGNFAAASQGVCDPRVNPYTLPANVTITHEQYGDQVILRIEGYVPSAFRCMVLSGKKVCVGTSNQNFGVSTLTDVGYAHCG